MMPLSGARVILWFLTSSTSRLLGMVPLLLSSVYGSKRTANPASQQAPSCVFDPFWEPEVREYNFAQIPPSTTKGPTVSSAARNIGAAPALSPFSSHAKKTINEQEQNDPEGQLPSFSKDSLSFDRVVDLAIQGQPFIVRQTSGSTSPSGTYNQVADHLDLDLDKDKMLKPATSTSLSWPFQNWTCADFAKSYPDAEARDELDHQTRFAIKDLDGAAARNPTRFRPVPVHHAASGIQETSNAPIRWPAHIEPDLAVRQKLREQFQRQSNYPSWLQLSSVVDRDRVELLNQNHTAAIAENQNSIADTFELWFSPPGGTAVHAHADGYCSLTGSIQIRGRKQWRGMMYPAGDSIEHRFNVFEKGIYRVGSTPGWEAGVVPGTSSSAARRQQTVADHFAHADAEKRRQREKASQKSKIEVHVATEVEIDDEEDDVEKIIEDDENNLSTKPRRGASTTSDRKILATAERKTSKEGASSSTSSLLRSSLWQPETDFVLGPGDMFFFPPGYVHETYVAPSLGSSLQDQCAIASTFQLSLPAPTKYLRSFFPRLTNSHLQYGREDQMLKNATCVPDKFLDYIFFDQEKKPQPFPVLDTRVWERQTKEIWRKVKVFSRRNEGYIYDDISAADSKTTSRGSTSSPGGGPTATDEFLHKYLSKDELLIFLQMKRAADSGGGPTSFFRKADQLVTKPEVQLKINKRETRPVAEYRAQVLRMRMLELFGWHDRDEDDRISLQEVFESVAQAHVLMHRQTRMGDLLKKEREINSGVVASWLVRKWKALDDQLYGKFRRKGVPIPVAFLTGEDEQPQEPPVGFDRKPKRRSDRYYRKHDVRYFGEL
ncbi:unnamed protein product [Amoebophrya sp. A120]|nr:unnamed protein product [Amoebophrya sp. A120]|eukprot:GSA120T00005119001.1